MPISRAQMGMEIKNAPGTKREVKPKKKKAKRKK